MKTFLINIGILGAIILAYYVDFLGWFVGKKALFFSFGLVIIMFIIAWKVLGSPFKEDKKDDNDDK